MEHLDLSIMYVLYPEQEKTIFIYIISPAAGNRVKKDSVFWVLECLLTHTYICMILEFEVKSRQVTGRVEIIIHSMMYFLLSEGCILSYPYVHPNSTPSLFPVLVWLWHSLFVLFLIFLYF